MYKIYNFCLKSMHDAHIRRALHTSSCIMKIIQALRQCASFAYNYKKKWNLIQKQPSCKKSMLPPRRPLWKKMWNPRRWPGNGCDGRLIAKILITTLQLNLPELLLLKFLLSTYHHSHFLAATLDFTPFFTMAFLGIAHCFIARLFLDYLILYI